MNRFTQLKQRTVKKLKIGWVVAIILFITESSSAIKAQQQCNPEWLPVKLENFPEARRVDVTVGGVLFTSYLYADTFEKPFLFPVIAANGITITRGYPIAPREGESVDHPHHTGFWFAYGNVNGVDYWGNSKAIAASEKSKYGIIRFKGIVRLEGNPVKGILEVNQDWVEPDGTIPLTEYTRFIFQSGKDFRMIERITTLTAQVPEVSFADTKEGAFAIRVARFLDSPSKEPRVFLDAYGRPTSVPVLNNDATGKYLSSEGIEGDRVWGARARWMKLSGVSGLDTISLVFMDHPDNLNYPTFWHARGYGLFSANPFGQKDFTSGKEQLNFRLKQGGSVTFRHRLYIRSGGDFSPAEIEKCWKEFSE